jgi:hypothetical protein
MTNYVYRSPTAADVDRHLRRHQLRELAPQVRRGNERAKAQYIELLEADGHHSTAELIADARWAKRGAPLLNPFEEIKRYFVAVMRGQVSLHRRRSGGRFPRGKRQELLAQIMTCLAEDGELDRLTEAERKRLPGAVINDLNRPKRKRARRR